MRELRQLYPSHIFIETVSLVEINYDEEERGALYNVSRIAKWHNLYDSFREERKEDERMLF